MTAAQAEIKKTLQWLNDETDRIIAEQQKKWGEEYRIDDERNRAAFKEVHAEFARREIWLG